MNPTKLHECRTRLRGYLRDLSDGEELDGSFTIARAAEQANLSPMELRAFRDGKDDVLPDSLIAVWSKLVSFDGVFDVGTVDSEDELRSWYRDQFGTDPAKRLARMDQYDTIEATRTEAQSALSCWADMVVTGSVGEHDRYGGGFEPQLVKAGDPLQQVVSDISYHINQHLLPESIKHQIVRDMAKYGASYEQIRVSDMGGAQHVTQTRAMSARSMRVNPVQNPKAAYALTQSSTGRVKSVYPSWKIAPFINKLSRWDLEGRSIFHSCLRSWVQVEAMESSMMIRRLERAPMRYKHKIDISFTSTPQDGLSAIDAHKQRLTKRRTVDTSADLKVQRIGRPPEEDLFVGLRGKDSPADVEALQGDANLDQIADFQHFFNKLLAGYGPPKAHLGYEADTTRSVATELTIVFARKARRMQANFTRGLNHLFWMELLLRNIDPREVQYVIFPPSLGTRDELIRAQVQMAHATTVRYLSQAFSTTGQQPSIKWFLRHVMQYDDDVIEAMELDQVMKKSDSPDGDPSQPTGPALSKPESEQMLNKILENDNVRAELRFARFMLDERRLAIATPSMLEKLGFGQRANFRPEFDPDFCREQLGMGRFQSALHG